MTIDSLQRGLTFMVLLLVQVLVLNQIHLFGVATPMLFVMMVIYFRRATPRWAVLLWSFAMGMMVDVFSNTAGVAASSLTLIGVMQPYLLEAFTPRDAAPDLKPSYRTLGAGAFTLFVIILVVVFSLVYFMLENFTFFNWLHWLLCSASSAALTVAFILVIDNFQTN